MNLDTASGYRPRTQETRAAYEAVLAFIREQFGDQPQDVLKGAAEEVLAVLKDDRKRVRTSKPVSGQMPADCSAQSSKIVQRHHFNKHSCCQLRFCSVTLPASKQQCTVASSFCAIHVTAIEQALTMDFLHAYRILKGKKSVKSC